MNRSTLLSNYTELNNSFKHRTLVYHIGFRYGFFSEYNNMILAMLYCLTHKMRFVLYSKDANFAYDQGWMDYFLPFCEETTDRFHSKHNHRDPLSTVFTQRHHPMIYFYKLKHPNRYLNFQLWNKFRNRKLENKIYNIPELGINGDFQSACRVLIELTWQYNAKTQEIIDTYKSSIQLPENFVGIHVRQGDKFLETNLLNITDYVEKAKLLSDIPNLFVLTDDYQVIVDIETQYPELNIYTLCDRNERGYFHDNFQKGQKETIRKSHEKLFASIDILAQSQLFIGTFSSNPGMFLGMRMPPGKTVGMDLKTWQIW